MNRNNKETVKMSLRDRAKWLAAKASQASALSMVAVGSAMAQGADLPTDIAAAEAWVEGKAVPILAFVTVVSLIIVAIKVAKLPRRA